MKTETTVRDPDSKILKSSSHEQLSSENSPNPMEVTAVM